jgi:hypothetical protein
MSWFTVWFFNRAIIKKKRHGFYGTILLAFEKGVPVQAMGGYHQNH